MHTFITKCDYDKICRTCLKSSENMTSVFDTEIVNMLTTCTTIALTINDGLPHQICTICFSKIFECYSFKQQCENSDQILREVLKNDEKRGEDVHNDLKSVDEDVKIKLELIDDKPLSIPDNFDNASVFDDDKQSIKDDSDDQDEFSDVSKTNTSFKNRLRQQVLEWGLEKCDPETFTCKICNRALAHLNSLIRHMESVHDEKPKFNFKCEICNKGFFEKNDLEKHETLKHKEKSYQCKHCEKLFFEIYSIRTHVKKSHPDSKIVCKECDKEFYLERDLNLHMKKHTNVQHVCKVCGKTFRYLSGLKDHEWMHSKERAFHCDQCDKSYKRQLLLNLHFRRVHASQKVREVCNVCGKAVVYLKGHLQTHNESPSNFDCTDCGRQFKNKYSLGRHIKRKHQNEDDAILNPFLCNMCGKRCENLSMLKRHFVTHTNLRTHKCDVCGKCFKAPDRLEFHIKHTHNDVRNYKCTYCPKSFHTKSALTIHIRVHTGERPYICKICHKAFQQRSSLTTHMKVHGLHSKHSAEEISKNIEVNLRRYKENSMRK